MSCTTCTESKRSRGYPPGPHKVKGAEWARLEARTTGGAVPLRAVSYQRLHVLASKVAGPTDRGILKDPGEWIAHKVHAAVT